jgi:hypothetical protein
MKPPRSTKGFVESVLQKVSYESQRSGAFCQTSDGKLTPDHTPWSPWLWRGLSVFFFLLTACGASFQPSKPLTSPRLNINTILVVPFEPVRVNGYREIMMYCPLCGATFEPGPMNRGDEKFMTKQLR